MGEVSDEEALGKLAGLIREGKQVVFLTGAGLSVASGVPAFRGCEDAVWAKHAKTWCTRATFLRDPVAWYESFWFKAFPHRFTKARPSPGHEAIARLAAFSDRVMVITQNVDSLHMQTEAAWDHGSQLIEVHGRIGLYRCSSGGQGACRLGWEEHLEGAARVFTPELARRIEDDDDDKKDHLHEGGVEKGGLSLGGAGAPLCPECGSAVLPLALLFDEDYKSHAFFQYGKARQWVESAAGLVFVGTSLSVNITRHAVDSARRRGVPVWNLNTKDQVHVTSTRRQQSSVYNLLGSAQDSLTRLLHLVLDTTSQPPTSTITRPAAPSKRPGGMGRDDVLPGMPPAGGQPSKRLKEEEGGQELGREGRGEDGCRPAELMGNEGSGGAAGAEGGRLDGPTTLST